MDIGKPRIFTNAFSEKLNGCYENESDGVSITIMRFKYFQKSLIEKIESDNKRILEELKKEDFEIANSMRNLFDIDTKLDFFIDQILKSNVVAIYSFFEFKLSEISGICEANKDCKKIKEFKADNGKPVSDIEKFNSFLKSEIISELKDYDALFEKLLAWKNIRVDIVHYNAKTKKSNIKNSALSGLKTVNGSIKFKTEDDIIDLLDQIENYLSKIIELINIKYNLIR